MTLDLALLALVTVFALLGAASGFARQLARLAALGVGYFCCRPLGNAVGPRLSTLLNVPQVFGVVAATLLAFLGVMIVVRYSLTQLLRRVFAGKAPDDRGLDRVLGFLLGGVRIAAIAYVVLCALAFVEDNVTVAGKGVGLSPKDSLAFGFARTHNVFEMTQFKGVRDLLRIQRAASDPRKVEKLQRDPAFQSLKKDPRFQRALADPQIRRASETGDSRVLLRANGLLQLVQDPVAAARLSAAADAAER